MPRRPSPPDGERAAQRRASGKETTKGQTGAAGEGQRAAAHRRNCIINRPALPVQLCAQKLHGPASAKNARRRPKVPENNITKHAAQPHSTASAGTGPGPGLQQRRQKAMRAARVARPAGDSIHSSGRQHKPLKQDAPYTHHGPHLQVKGHTDRQQDAPPRPACQWAHLEPAEVAAPQRA